MKPLPIEFTEKGYVYAQVERDDSVAVYSQAKYGRVLAYEVVRIRQAPAEVLFGGAELPEREIYPGANTWGKLGFTCMSLEDARKRAKTLRRAN